MSPVLVAQHEHGSPEWHAVRANGIGGSEIGAIVGVSPWESRFSLWWRKKGDIGPQEQNSAMEWGKRLEAPILAKFREDHPDLIEQTPGTYQHAEREWMIANPDAWFKGCVVDAKFSAYGDGWGEAGTDRIPPHVDAQLRWYMEILGVDLAHLAVLIGGYDYREFTIEADPRETEILVAAGEDFMRSLAENERPDIDEHSETYRAIRELHPDIDGVEVELTDETARKIITATAALKDAEGAAQMARSLVADEMGTAKKATWDGIKVADRRVRGQGIPYVQVVGADRLPDLGSKGEAA